MTAVCLAFRHPAMCNTDPPTCNTPRTRVYSRNRADDTPPSTVDATVWISPATSDSLGTAQGATSRTALLSDGVAEPVGDAGWGVQLPVLPAASMYDVHWSGLWDPDYPPSAATLLVEVSMGVYPNTTNLVGPLVVPAAASRAGVAPLRLVASQAGGSAANITSAAVSPSVTAAVSVAPVGSRLVACVRGTNLAGVPSDWVCSAAVLVGGAS